MPETGALAPVVARVFVKKRPQAISICVGSDVDAIIAGEPLEIRSCASSPFGRSTRPLVFTVVGTGSLIDAGSRGSTDKRVRAKRIEQVFPETLWTRGLNVCLPGLRGRRSCSRRGLGLREWWKNSQRHRR